MRDSRTLRGRRAHRTRAAMSVLPDRTEIDAHSASLRGDCPACVPLDPASYLSHRGSKAASLNQAIPGIENQQVRRCSPGEHCVKTSRRGSNCVPRYSGIFRFIPGCAAVFHDPRHSCRACLARDAAHRHIVATNSAGPDVPCVKRCHFKGLQTYIGGIRRLSGCNPVAIAAIPAKSLSSPVLESPSLISSPAPQTAEPAASLKLPAEYWPAGEQG